MPVLCADMHWTRSGDPFAGPVGMLIGGRAGRVSQLYRSGHSANALAIDRIAGISLATARKHGPLLLSGAIVGQQLYCVIALT